MTARRSLGGGRVRALISCLALGWMIAASPAAAADPRRQAGTQVVSGVTVDPAALPSAGSALSERERANARVANPRDHSRPGVAVPATGRTLPHRGGSRASSSAASIAPADTTPTPGLFDLNLPTDISSTAASEPTGAILGTTTVMGTHDRIYADSTLDYSKHVGNWANSSFFGLPGTDFYYGSSIASSIYRGRYLAVLPSFDGPGAACAHGWLNFAVSTTANPTGAWLRYRIAVTDSWTDEIRIGLSDDKIVLATDVWDLDGGQPDCLGSTFEGGHLRVLDWTDLIDGGTVTIKDLSPSPATSYYGWAPSQNVPGTSSTAAGATIELAVDRNVGGWGHLGHARITGSAKAATAAVVLNEDLTSLGVVDPLVGPPDTIAALPSGNGFQDERLVSASWRSGQLWISTTSSCRVDPDPTFRACVRYVHLDTSTTPATLIEDVWIGDVERDTFLPLVGFSRDGWAYFVMAASSAVAHEAIDEYALARSPGSPVLGGTSEARVWEGTQTYESAYWGLRGSIMVEPNDARGVWAFYPAQETWTFGAMETHLKGGQTGTPGGTAILGNGRGWIGATTTYLILSPTTSSPTTLVRYSASPTTAASAGGARLTSGRDLPSIARIFNIDLTDATIGGIPAPTKADLYVQWQTVDGTWSVPVHLTAGIDRTPPAFTGPTLAYAPGTVGTTVPVRVSWTTSDAQSGIQFVQVFWQRSSPFSQVLVPYPAGTTNVVRAVTVGGRYMIDVQSIDKADNGSGGYAPTVIFGAVQQTSSAVKYSGTWTSSSSSSFFGGSVRYATRRGATATYTFTGRGIAFVTTKAKTRGKVEVYIDGLKRQTIDLYSSTTRLRQLVYQASWAASGTHTIKIRVLGTAGRPRVDLDAFLRF
jgi:hypothetical protein